jgi:hypothetical protein
MAAASVPVFTVGKAEYASSLFQKKVSAHRYTFTSVRSAQITQPRVIKYKSPVEIPLEKKLSHKTTKDQVTVGLIISETGHVIDTVVIESTDKICNPYAIQAVQGWEFMPATVDGKPACFFCVVPYGIEVRSNGGGK